MFRHMVLTAVPQFCPLSKMSTPNTSEGARVVMGINAVVIFMMNCGLMSAGLENDNRGNIDKYCTKLCVEITA